MLDRSVPLAHLPTPLEPADRLGAALGSRARAVGVKRDDLTGLAGGGNKVRKLEHLCADALAQGCDTLVTGGGRQSNHARMTAAAANQLGLRLHHRPRLGPARRGHRQRRPRPPPRPRDRVGRTARVLRPRGRHRGRSRPARAARDAGPTSCRSVARRPSGSDRLRRRRRRAARAAPDLALVVTADGSGGTHAGLVAGLGRPSTRCSASTSAPGPTSTTWCRARPTAAAALAGRRDPGRHVPHRPRPHRRRLRRADRALPRGARPRGPLRGPAPRPRLHGQGDGRADRRGRDGACRPPGPSCSCTPAGCRRSCPPATRPRAVG